MNNLAWEKNADLFLAKMGDIKILTKYELEKTVEFIVDVNKFSKIDYLKRFIAQCKEIKNIDQSLFLKHYDDIIVNDFIDAIGHQKNDYCKAWLASDLIDLHQSDISSGKYNFVLIASMAGNYDLLVYFIEKDVSFTHKNDTNHNIFHTFAISDEKGDLTDRSLRCIEYLMNENNKVGQFLMQTNYQMLCEKNDKGLSPVAMYLSFDRPEFALCVVNQMNNLDVLKKIQQQLSAYSKTNKLSEKSKEVLTHLNEKTMIYQEKDALCSVISGNSSNKDSKNHKI